jgi:hypothetical protein
LQGKDQALDLFERFGPVGYFFSIIQFAYRAFAFSRNNMKTDAL